MRNILDRLASGRLSGTGFIAVRQSRSEPALKQGNLHAVPPGKGLAGRRSGQLERCGDGATPLRAGAGPPTARFVYRATLPGATPTSRSGRRRLAGKPACPHKFGGRRGSHKLAARGGRASCVTVTVRI
jgi:hypothetical protein